MKEAIVKVHGVEVDLVALEADLRDAIDGEVRFDLGSKVLWITDGSNYRHVPLGVVLPKSYEDVEKIVAICYKHRAPILARGCGTSLAGNSCGPGVIIDMSKHLTKIIEINTEERYARVQGGVICDQLRNEAEKYNLTYGPDPATHNHCTLGGMIGNNSCGIHSVMAGRTADNILEMEVLTYDGFRFTAGPTSEEELNRIIAEGGRKGEIYKGLKEIRDQYADQIRKKYPKIPRRVSGYNLDDLLPENGFNVARALVGSESTCITMLEAKVRLVHSPPKRTLLVVGYPDVFQAADHVPQLMSFGPIGLEGIDEQLITYMKKKGMHPQDIQLLPEGKGWLLVEFGGDTKDDCNGKAKKAMEILQKEKNPPSLKLFTDKGEEAMVWEIRESGLGATANVPDEPLMWPGWEDAGLPPEKVGDYLRDFRQLLNKYRYKASLYGHFGQGCIHCRISFELRTHDGVQQYMKFLDDATSLVASYGGSFSAEHGDGQARAIFLPKMYGPELMEAFKKFKTLFDPEWKMNPGKVINPRLPDDDLRLGVNYRPWQPDTYFQFPKDHHSMPAATLRCVGVGKCRRTSDAFMCPSFLVTKDEKDTTRGRAHLLFEMFRGDVITNKWKSKEVLESLDLCLGCKGCKLECPVSVDIATYKSEFLAHHYAHKIRPRKDYAMGLITYWAKMGSMVPWLANFMSHAPGMKHLARAMAGVSQKREMPTFAKETFTSWFSNRQVVNPDGEPVLLFPDAFNNHFMAHTLKSATKALENWGFRVCLPEGYVHAIRPLIHYGFLKMAQKKLKSTVEQLRPFVDRGLPIIFLEPSTAAVYREELRTLFPNDQDGLRIAEKSLLFSEFVEDRDLDLPEINKKAVFHGHCHQKAVLNPDAARNMLKRMKIDAEEPWEGCCGMAGSFGFEAEHYDLSMQISELKLLPTVRKAGKDDLIIADGFSCRSQIQDGTGRNVMHMAEVVLMGMEQAAKAAPERKEEKAPEPVEVG